MDEDMDQDDYLVKFPVPGGMMRDLFRFWKNRWSKCTSVGTNR